MKVWVKPMQWHKNYFNFACRMFSKICSSHKLLRIITEYKIQS